MVRYDRLVHLHVHAVFTSRCQAIVSALVDKAITDSMKGIAVTDHMEACFAIMSSCNYVNKKNGPVNGEIKKKKTVGIAGERGR